MWGRLSPCAWCGSGGSVCSPSWRPGWCQHPWVGTVCSWSHVNSLWHLLSHRSTTYPTNWCYWGCYLISQDNRWWNVLGSHRQGSTSWCSIATGDPLRRYSMLISVKVVVHSLFTSVLSCHSSAGCTLLLISQKFPTHSYPSRMCQSRRYRTRKSKIYEWKWKMLLTKIENSMDKMKNFIRGNQKFVNENEKFHLWKSNNSSMKMKISLTKMKNCMNKMKNFTCEGEKFHWRNSKISWTKIKKFIDENENFHLWKSKYSSMKMKNFIN